MSAVRVRVGQGRYIIAVDNGRGWFEPAFNGQQFTARQSRERLRSMEKAVEV